jgi:NADH:ubiquinone oxidoreductase subunit 6 (subunit J)
MLLYLLQPTTLLFFIHTIVLFFLFSLFLVRNVLLSVLILICLFISVAFCFIFLDAVYLSLVFIIVYVGAIAILFLFVIMLTNKIYAPRQKFSVIIFLLVINLLLIEFVFLNGLNLLSGDFFWVINNFLISYLGDVRIRLLVSNDPLVAIGFTFFNFWGSYVLGLGILLVVVLVGIVVLLRKSLGNGLIVYRTLDIEQLRWQRLLRFRDFVPLKKNDSTRD